MNLTLILQKYVNENYLSKIALDLKINNFILTQEGDELKYKASILADVVESLIAGIYLDSNMTECKKFIYNKVLKNNLKITNLKNILNLFTRVFNETFQISS